MVPLRWNDKNEQLESPQFAVLNHPECSLLAGGEEVVVKGEFTANDVHKQYGICLRAPAYVDRDIAVPARCAMYLYRPKGKASSEPVDFWYLPAAAKAAAVAAAPSAVNDLSRTPDIKPVKRGRAPRAAHDDPSSGQVTVPPKAAAPAPAAPQLHGGGVVSVVGQYGSYGNNVGSPGGQQYSPVRSPYEQVALDQSVGGLTLRPVLGPQGPQATPVQAPAPEEKVNPMTQELQDLLRGDPQGDAAGGGGLPHLNAYLQRGGDSNAAGAGGAFVQQDFAPAPPLQTINISEGDLTGAAPGEMENLSSNLGSIKLEKLEPRPSSSDPGLGPSSLARQTSQLHTPDVSMSVEDAKSGQQQLAKRNNLNR